MAHGGRLERRCRHQREHVSHSRENFARRLERRVDLAPEVREPEREGARPRVLAREELVGVEPVALLRGDPARRRVRVRQETLGLELGQVVAYGRGRNEQPGALDERARADGLSRRHVFLNDASEDVPLPRRELACPVRHHLQEF